MKVGDLVKASWLDGMEATGVYSGEERGFIILLDEESKKIPCNKFHVKFEIINPDEDSGLEIKNN